MKCHMPKVVLALALIYALKLPDTAAFGADLDIIGLVQIDVTDVQSEDDSLRAGDALRNLKLGFITDVSDTIDLQLGVAVSSDGNVNLDDSFLAFHLSENASLLVGHLKVHHTLAAATGEVIAGFEERSMASNAFAVGTGGQLGAFFRTHGRNWNLQTGVSFNDLNEDTAATNGWGLHGRFSYAPYLTDEAFVHVGASYYYRNEDDDLLTISVQPENWLTGPPVFSTGEVAANHYQYADLEFSASRGPLRIDAEYAGLKTGGFQNYNYDGGYVAATYVLTGEHRKYLVNFGVPSLLQPANPVSKQGYGAWEIAVRYSHLDLQSGGMGSKGYNWSASLNWYPVRDLRFMLNITDFKSTGTVTREGHTLGLRTQVMW